MFEAGPFLTRGPRAPRRLEPPVSRVHPRPDRDPAQAGARHRGGAGPGGGPQPQRRPGALAPEASPLPSGAYRPLLLALLATLADREAPARVAALLREAGRRLATQLGGTPAGGAGTGGRP